MNAVAQLQTAAQPRRYFAVTRPDETPPVMVYSSREHAEAVCTMKQYELSAIGPWEVVELAEVLP